MIEAAYRGFADRYGKSGEILCFFAPGRVNLIGEHLDYNGGMVLPAALSLGIYGLLRYRKDRLICLASLDMAGKVEVESDRDIVYREEDGWANYPKGVIRYLRQSHALSGCDILYAATLPHSVGLSSSAALEILTASMLLHGTEIDRIAVARMCQEMENRFIGVNCGIMDQFAVAMGKKGHAILLDCGSLEYEYIPLRLENYVLLIMDTHKKRELAESRYNERRGECAAALEILRTYRQIDNLCQAHLEDVARMGDTEPARRARHVVTEQERVRQAVASMARGDLRRMGELLAASHRSLREDYRVTGFYLDQLVDEASDTDGCIGARMTGAGFGGCAIALVEAVKAEAFCEKVVAGYRRRSGLPATCYRAEIVGGAGMIDVGAVDIAGKF